MINWTSETILPWYHFLWMYTLKDVCSRASIPFSPWTQCLYVWKLSGQRDGLASKCACHVDWQPAFDSQISHGERREQTCLSFLLISKQGMYSHITHLCAQREREIERDRIIVIKTYLKDHLKSWLGRITSQGEKRQRKKSSELGYNSPLLSSTIQDLWMKSRSME